MNGLLYSIKVVIWISTVNQAATNLVYSLVCINFSSYKLVRINLSQVSIFHSSSPSYLCDFAERCPLSCFLNMGILVFEPV